MKENELSEYDLSLLRTLKEKEKFLHMGSSPVSAISSAFKMCELEFISMNEGWLNITIKGLEKLKEKA